MNLSFKILHNLKYLYKNNPLLYRLWFFVYRSRSGFKLDMINNKTKVLFDGYPRSGNTYALFLIRKIFDRDKIAHHFHSIAPIKISLKKKIKIIIIIRHPLDAVSSLYLKKFEKKTNLPKKIDKSLINVLIKDYIIYYKYVNKYQSNFYLVNFNYLIENPISTIEKIKVYIDGFITQKEINIISENKDKKFGSNSILGSSTPSLQKNSLKKNIKKKIRNSLYYNNCLNIYNKILEDENIN